MSDAFAFELVVFDCDGVLVDTEPVIGPVLAKRLGLIGVDIDAAEVDARYLGNALPSVLADVAERHGVIAPEDFAEGFYAACFAAFDEYLDAVPGIEGVIADLERRGVPTCVASSGPHPKMRKTLGITGLRPRFEGRIFSATEVERGKPAPDLFLHAAARMGVAPERCAVIEDSPAGIAAAQAAGMTPFGFSARTAAERLAGEGVTVFGDMAELPALLATAR